jgi:exonuclease VII large subunit
MNDISKEEMKDRLGNIDQIRHLLFGNKIKEYEQLFESNDNRLDKLESELTNFQTEMRDRLTELQESLSSEIRSGLDSLEKKLKYLSLTTHEETSKLQQSLESTNKKIVQGVESLDKKVNYQANFLRNEVSQTREKLEEEFQLLKQQFFAEMEKGMTDLKEGKVSRRDLAEVLFELCLKIKGTEFVPSLREAADHQVQADFLLPEQSETQQTPSE